MYDKLDRVAALLKEVNEALDPEVLHPTTAVDLVKKFSAIEKLACSGKAIASARVASSGVWRAEGDRSPAHFIARATGDTVGTTVAAIVTAERVGSLPKVQAAFRSGELTLGQAADIASAATVSPSSEGHLLSVAKTHGASGLKQECRRVEAAACPDEKERSKRLHASRYLRTWSDPDGAFRMDARLTPEAGAEIKATLDGFAEEGAKQAKKHKVACSYEALWADALLQMSRCAREGGGRSLGPTSMVLARVDAGVLERGFVSPGEVCEVPGIGPIPVSAVKTFLADAVIKLVVTKDGEPIGAAHVGRSVSSAKRAALSAAHPTCAISGCGLGRGLEIDHLHPRELNGDSKLPNLARICSFHHALKTYEGFEVRKVKGACMMVPPETNKRSRAGPRARKK